MRLTAAATVVASLGLVAHNLLSLPLSPLALETVGPLAVYAALLAWLVLTRGSGARLAMLAWATLNTIGGGILSVLPLPFLPFVPEQTAAHYVAHVTYALAQVPLIAALLWTGAWPRAIGAPQSGSSRGGSPLRDARS